MNLRRIDNHKTKNEIAAYATIDTRVVAKEGDAYATNLGTTYHAELVELWRLVEEAPVG